MQVAMERINFASEKQSNQHLCQEISFSTSILKFGGWYGRITGKLLTFMSLSFIIDQ